jgi:hypothetical protein
MHSFARLALIGSVTFAFAAAACGGDVVVDDDSSGSGGSGASSSTAPSTPTSSSSSSSSSGLPSTVSASSSGSMSTSTGPCQTCAEAVSVGQIPAANVCPGQSKELYDALVSCLCAGICAGACTDNLCLGNAIDSECANCIQASCASPLGACANDI